MITWKQVYGKPFLLVSGGNLCMYLCPSTGGQYSCLVLLYPALSPGINLLRWPWIFHPFHLEPLNFGHPWGFESLATEYRADSKQSLVCHHDVFQKSALDFRKVMLSTYFILSKPCSRIWSAPTIKCGSICPAKHMTIIR